MQTIRIRGRDYIQVNERIKEFRSNSNFEGWAIVTEIVHLTDENCVIKATITDKDGMVRATGHAQEDRSSSVINKTSYVENCETSAVGRALGMLGIGIDTSVASADEVEMAIAKQEQEAKEELTGGDYVFQGGQYKGKKIREVPKEYLDWCLTSGASANLKANIKRYYADNAVEVEI